MAINKNCGQGNNNSGTLFNNSNYVFIVLILYILLAIILGGVLY